MGAIRQWALSIVVFLIFQGMMEVLIPKGSVKEIHPACIGDRILMIAVGPVLQFFSTGSHRYVLLQDFPELTETTAVAQRGVRKNAAGDSGKAIWGCPGTTVFRRAGPGGKVLDEIRVACTSQGGDQSIAVKIRSPEEKQEGIQIDLGYIQVGDNSKPEQGGVKPL